MPYLYCSKCGYKKLIPIAKYRFIGIGISAFGVFWWFSFLFAGSGHAFLIACSIFFFGIYFFYNAEDLAKSSSRDKPCPKCNGTIYEDSDPFDKKDQYVDVEALISYKAATSIPITERIPSSGALFYVGKTISVYGNVSEVIHFDNRTFINLGEPYPREEISILILNNDLSSFTQVFNDLSNWEGYQICCTGTIEIYKQHIQMKIHNPEMIKVMPWIDI